MRSFFYVANSIRRLVYFVGNSIVVFSLGFLCGLLYFKGDLGKIIQEIIKNV